MSEQSKSKILILIIGSLLLANIVLLSFLLMNNKNRGAKNQRSDRKAYISNYLEKEVGFTGEQMATYDSLSKKHREQVKSRFKEISDNRRTILSGLATTNFSDSAINEAAGSIHASQKTLELNMLKHLKEIRNICTEAQRVRFDTGFYKIFGRRGEKHK